MSKKLILILSEPRTGSNLLNDALNLYAPIQPINEFFLKLRFYIGSDFVRNDLPHKTLINDTERKQLFNFLTIEQENYTELIKQINKTPVEALLKLYEITPKNLVVKIHRHQLKNLHLQKLLKLPYTEVILLERSSRLHSHVSRLKAKHFDKWHNVDTSNIKIPVNVEQFIYEQEQSIEWYKAIRQQLFLKEYLEINYEKDLENFSKEHFYSLFDPWFKKINLSVKKTNYEFKYFKKQNNSPIENSIFNYDEIKHLVRKTII